MEPRPAARLVTVRARVTADGHGDRLSGRGDCPGLSDGSRNRAAGAAESVQTAADVVMARVTVAFMRHHP